MNINVIAVNKIILTPIFFLKQKKNHNLFKFFRTSI